MRALFLSCGLLFALVPRAASAQEAPKPTTRLDAAAIDIDADADLAPSTGTICWYRPKRTSTKDRNRLRDAIEGALEKTKPKHVDYEFVRAKSRKHARKLECIATIDVTKARKYNSTKKIQFVLEKPGVDEPLIERTLVLDLKKIEAEQLVELWTDMWPLIAPAPPEPPKPPPPPPEEFVDSELKQEQAAEIAARQVAEEPRAPIVGVLVEVGMLARSLDDTAPGRPVNQSGLFSLGAEATLYVASLAGIQEEHDIDVDVSYRYRFASTSDANVGAAVDRFNAGAAYRYRFSGAFMPRVGVLAGYELLRNEVDPSAGAYSVRYSALRTGLSIVEPLIDDGPTLLSLFVDGAARFLPGADGGDTGVGFDIGGGVRASYDRWIVRARVRYAQQSVTVSGTGFNDGFLDLDLSLGVEL